MLASPASRGALLNTLGKSDPLIRDALETVLDRGDFIPSVPNEEPAWAPPGEGSETVETDPDIPVRLIAQSEASIAELKREIRMKRGAALLDLSRRTCRTIWSGSEPRWVRKAFR